ncbi:chitin synthase-domain-containing protein [Gorgonomyces haynaldii]|nr:chitin synthase-domain-containing protein [Gorgonomyces haynaldii]
MSVTKNDDDILGRTGQEISSLLVSRHQKDNVYTRIGRHLVAIRPLRALAKNTDNASKEQAELAKQADALIAPHVFDTAASAFYHSMREQQDQTILLLGESASGKSESYRMITRHLCDLTKTSKKKTKVHSHTLKVDSVLSAFGNATTPFNPDASCFTRYTEFQFQKGKMVGMKLIEYLLEKSRVSGPVDGGYNFHIFYYLLAGATTDERVNLHLSDPAHFHYLSAVKTRTIAFAQTKGQDHLSEIRDALKSLGIGRRQQAQLWQLLAAVLHLGNITFAPPHRDNEACSIKNYPQLQLVADMLGVTPSSLQNVLIARIKYIGTDAVSSYLDVDGASRQRDALARSLYAIIFSWIVEQINIKLCAPETDWSNFVSVLEIPGFAGVDVQGNSFHRLLLNFANERVHFFVMQDLFEIQKQPLIDQGIEFPEISYSSNREILETLSAVKRGILPMVDIETARGSSDVAITEGIYKNHLDSGVLVSASSKNMKHAFGIHHYCGIVEYDTRGFSELDQDVLQSSFVTLVRGNPQEPGTSNPFLRSMFSDKIIATRHSERDGKTVVSANARTRFPSLRRKSTQRHDDEDEALDVSAMVGHTFRGSLNEILDTVSTTKLWLIYHLKFNKTNTGKLDPAYVEKQLNNFDIPALAQHPAISFSAQYEHQDFVSRFNKVVSLWDRNPKTACEAMFRYRNWTKSDALVGNSAILLGERAWRGLELKLKEKEDAEEAKNSTTSSPAVQQFQHIEKPDSEFGGTDDDATSHYGSEFEFHQPQYQPGQTVLMKPGDVEMGNLGKNHPPADVKRPITPLRWRWLTFVWATTFCFPPFCLSCCGMRKRDRQIAWREKVALVLIVLLMNASILFFIIGIGQIVCPRTSDKSPGEVSALFDVGPRAAIYMYGNYYFINDLIPNHISQYQDQKTNSPIFWKQSVLGHDVAQMFPKDDAAVWSTYCKLRQPTNPPFQLLRPIPDNIGWYRHGKANNVDLLKTYRKGRIVWDVNTIQDRIASTEGYRFLTIYDNVYDVTSFYDPSLNNQNNFFLGSYFKNVSDQYSKQAGYDATWLFESLRKQDPTQYANVMTCLNGLFYVGGVDHRNDLKCTITNYILLAASIILVCVIGFKFLAALNFGGNKQPEDHDKFVICQVPCYTEGEESLRRTIDSLANMTYDDKHKLLFIICDGMIIGSGNDRPTPRIVLDLLGVDPSYDPEAYAFQSLGEGNAQLNYGKVYSGLYEINGHVVPFIVVVKVGKPGEAPKPGNRGKRDSQMILMRFLSRVHFNQPMSPLQLEIYHQMKNVIGVDPSFYEFVFMVDADTMVHKDALNHLVSEMTRDTKICGTCGETSIANERKSFTTMIQVYEYFISHHLSKAFESMFGSVTCLPGCFCMYRVRSATKNTPILIAPGVIADYAENQVDTLHLKNLLHLGEDRYLTTLMMKHFPNMKTTFNFDAKCVTYAPETWAVLLSQRRRWINSTVHNLFELLRLNELCGFCCFSMRFVVFIDLLATFIQPSALVYIVYLVVISILDPNPSSFPVISLIMLGAVYGFQVIIFLLKTQWQHIGWMILYLLGIPLFGFYIPLYSFWHFDDFSWGNTRLVVDPSGNKKTDEEVVVEPFDPQTIQLMKWSDYEAAHKELDDAQSVTSYQTGYSKGSELKSSFADSRFGSLPRRSAPGRFPTDDEILAEVRHILSTTDLMKLTKKSVRDRLGRLFGVDLSSKKEYIHQCIDGILKGEL